MWSDKLDSVTFLFTRLRMKRSPLIELQFPADIAIPSAVRNTAINSADDTPYANLYLARDNANLLDFKRKALRKIIRMFVLGARSPGDLARGMHLP